MVFSILLRQTRLSIVDINKEAKIGKQEEMIDSYTKKGEGKSSWSKSRNKIHVTRHLTK